MIMSIFLSMDFNSLVFNVFVAYPRHFLQYHCTEGKPSIAFIFDHSDRDKLCGTYLLISGSHKGRTVKSTK